MASVIIPTVEPLTAAQRSQLETLLASPGLSLLKSMIAAQQAMAQIKAADARMYPTNKDLVAMAQAKELEAQQLNAALDVLDDFDKKPDEWFTVRLEQRR